MTGWLLVRVDQGMFSDEYAVTYPPIADHWQKSVFVPASLVRSANHNQGEVQVKVVVQGDTRYAVLPSSEGDVVKVEKPSDLR